MKNDVPDSVESISDVGMFIDGGYARGKTLYASSKHDAFCYLLDKIGKAYGVAVLCFFDGVSFTKDGYQIRVIYNRDLAMIRDGLMKVIRGIEDSPRIAGSLISEDDEWVLQNIKEASASLEAAMPEGCEYFYLFVYLKSILALINAAISDDTHFMFEKSSG